MFFTAMNPPLLHLMQHPLRLALAAASQIQPQCRQPGGWLASSAIRSRTSFSVSGWPVAKR